jgi:DNA-binding SARP family transcriptional activator
MLLFTARALELMASGASSSGEAGDAALLHGAAASIRESIGAAMWPVDRALHEPYVLRARAALGSRAYGAALSKGRLLGADEGVALAFAVSEKLGALTEPDRTWDTREYRIPDLALQPSAPSLSVRSLGALDVAVNGVPLTRKDWTYSKARELLLFLLLHPSGQTREQVGVALWPDASSAQLRNSFHVALHHLRRALGSVEWVRFENDRYRLDVPGGVAFDAAAFDEALTRGLRAARQGSLPFEAVDSALQSYRGDFLEGEPVGDWHLEMRDRLARLYSDGLQALGDALLRAGCPADAIPVLERLVQREPILESGWRALMQARAQSGDSAGLARDYRRLVEVLRREGYPEPGRETLELFRRLTRGT